MAVNWVNPTLTIAGLAVKNHKELGGFFTAVWNKLTKTLNELAITGTEGVGKSVLLDNLTGKAFEPGYTKPLKSQREEQGAVQSKQRIRASVVPGQLAAPRYLSLDKLFTEKKQVDGVIHVVSAGLQLIREDDRRQKLVDQQVRTIREYRLYHRGVELNDLKETCEAIRAAHRRYHSPKWLIVAVDKIDLFHDKFSRSNDTTRPTTIRSSLAS